MSNLAVNFMTKKQFDGFKARVNTVHKAWPQAMQYALYHAMMHGNTDNLNDLTKLAPCRTSAGNLSAYGKVLRAYVVDLELTFLRWNADKSIFEYKHTGQILDIIELPLFTDYESFKEAKRLESAKKKAVKDKAEKAEKAAITETRESAIVAEREKAEKAEKLAQAKKNAAKVDDAQSKVDLEKAKAEAAKAAQVAQEKEQAAQAAQARALMTEKERMQALGAMPASTVLSALKRFVHTGVHHAATAEEIDLIAKLLHDASVIVADKRASRGNHHAEVDSAKAMESLQVKPSAKAKAAGKKAA